MTESSADVWSDGSWIHVRCAYSKKFVDLVKSRISPLDRAWDEDTKIWKFKESVRPMVLAILNERFVNVNFRGVESRSGSSYHEMISHLPTEVLTKVYKTIVVAVHPDHGHDPSLLARTNGAWDKIKKERG